jgi:hypothetical protein
MQIDHELRSLDVEKRSKPNYLLLIIAAVVVAVVAASLS